MCTVVFKKCLCYYPILMAHLSETSQIRYRNTMFIGRKFVEPIPSGFEAMQFGGPVEEVALLLSQPQNDSPFTRLLQQSSQLAPEAHDPVYLYDMKEDDGKKQLVSGILMAFLPSKEYPIMLGGINKNMEVYTVKHIDPDDNPLEWFLQDRYTPAELYTSDEKIQVQVRG